MPEISTKLSRTPLKRGRNSEVILIAQQLLPNSADVYTAQNRPCPPEIPNWLRGESILTEKNPCFLGEIRDFPKKKMVRCVSTSSTSPHFPLIESKFNIPVLVGSPEKIDGKDGLHRGKVMRNFA
ncbi:hypothetical protein BV898_04805 [Hypsibius exemplaris]|uniref:Uncharacterized protein n=1 Tax=Hypsibius exemplaris TaxID=2072580 RepID=A0A1W0X1N4_HYPEX|nr:hypothetical protein BV898_04805 [Hypsibius exemplaris]